MSLLVAGLTVVTAVALLALFRDLPQAALGAVVISAVIGFLDMAAMERVRRLLRDSFVIALVAMVAVLALGVLQGLILAVVVSVGELLIRSSRPSRSVLGRLPGTTAFVARENAPEARTVPGVLASLRHELEGQGLALWLGGVHAEVLNMLVRSGLADDDIGRAHLYRDLEDAVGDASA